jgi:threonine/homoserine/homoserine lactone efflux protein
MPGPVFAAAVVKGAENKYAGLWIAFGHLIVEIPLILVIAAGFYFIFTHQLVQIGIGLVGGALLLYMGVRMIQIRGEVNVVEKAFPAHPMIVGIMTTASNPYFIFWWATIGAVLIIQSIEFGILGIVLFIIVHESCDLGWDHFVSYSVHESKRFWTKNMYAWVFGICGLLLVIFGVYFMVGVVIFN